MTGRRELLRQPQRLEPPVAVEEHAIRIDRVQRRAVRAVDALADLISFVFAPIAGDDDATFAVCLYREDALERKAQGGVGGVDDLRDDGRRLLGGFTEQVGVGKHPTDPSKVRALPSVAGREAGATAEAEPGTSVHVSVAS